MASVTGSFGIVSGKTDLGLDSLFDNITKMEDSKLDVYKTKQDSIKTKISSYGTLKSSLDAINSAGNALKSPSLFQSASATGSVQSFGVQATDSKASGKYSVEISQLAQAKSASSDRVEKKDTVLGSGTLSLKVGGQQANIDVKDGSLASVRDAINNAKGADNKPLGVSATLINDGQGYRLSVSSLETGVDKGFDLSASGDDGLTSVINGMQTKKEAMNSRFNVNGIDIEKSSNTVSDAVEGLTLDFVATTTKPETFQVDKNPQPGVDAVNQFVNAYNQMMTTSKNMTLFNSKDVSKSGALFGDSGVRSMQSQLRNAVGGSTETGTLLDLGISFKDNMMVVDKDKLTKTLAEKGSTAMDVFNGKDGKSGIMGKVTSSIDGMLGDKGIYKASVDVFNRMSKSQDTQLERATVRHDATLARMKKELTQLAKFQSMMDNQMSRLQQQFDGLNNSKK